MNTFRLRLITPVKMEQVDDVVSFMAKDATGSFGILANAFRRITVLSFGIAAYSRSGGSVEYLGLPGGVLYFSANELRIATTSFVHSSDVEEISAALNQKICIEEETIREIKDSLHRLDEEILKRLSQMSQTVGRKAVP